MEFLVQVMPGLLLIELMLITNSVLDCIGLRLLARKLNAIFICRFNDFSMF